jgi:DNA polymerase-3 subunit epsilon
MLREMQQVRHLELPDPLSAEIIESRLIARMLPRYNRAGTRADKYCYVRLDTESPWPRLAVVKQPSAKGLHLGPLTSRTLANLVVEALQSVLPLRRCSTRLGVKHEPPEGATPCSAAQLGVSQCPCAGVTDRARYDDAVAAAVRAMSGDPAMITEQLTIRMSRLAAAQRFEEAAMVRDRLSALLNAVRRHQLVAALRAADRCVVRRGDTTWVIDRARLTDTSISGAIARALPVDAPDAPGEGRPIDRKQVDEALCLAKYFDKHAHRIEVVECSGEWRFPIDTSDKLPRLSTPVVPDSETQPVAVRAVDT